MIDLHTHTILSDGELVPSELVRRAEALGYKAIALTDHCDRSNIDFVVPRLVKIAESLSRYWKIKVLPGVELTHVPLEDIGPLVEYAREHGAKVVIGHGETTSEPVIKGTNRRAIECGVTILAHPGNITEEDARLAAENGVYLELTTRKSHSTTNKHVAKTARAAGAKMVLNNDAHSSEDLFTEERARQFLAQIGLTDQEIDRVLNNSRDIAASL